VPLQCIRKKKKEKKKHAPDYKFFDTCIYQMLGEHTWTRKCFKGKGKKKQANTGSRYGHISHGC
jgi:hypothetical protein